MKWNYAQQFSKLLGALNKTVIQQFSKQLTLNRRRDVLNVTQKRLPYAERTFKTSPKR